MPRNVRKVKNLIESLCHNRVVPPLVISGAGIAEVCQTAKHPLRVSEGRGDYVRVKHLLNMNDERLECSSRRCDTAKNC